MAKVTPIQNSFSAGEITPLLDGRVDIASYFNSAKTVENFIPLPQGGLKRRPGTYYVTEVKDSSRKTRLIPFQFSTTQAYLVELGDRYMRFYTDNGQLLSGGVAYEIVTPYLEADLFDIQFAQDADTMWLTHPSYKTRKLTRAGPNWDSYNKLMLHCDGTDGSTTFTDSATAKTVTASGTAQIDTAQYKFGGGSGMFDGDSDYLTIPDSADFDFENGDFTIDFWINLAASPATQMEVYSQWADASNRIGFAFYESTPGVIGFDANVDSASDINVNLGGTVTMDIGTWYHFAWVRSGDDFTVYQDGIALKTKNQSGDMPNIAADLTLGYWEAPSGYYLNGYIDEMRVSKGIARWTANFTPPTVAYAADVVTFALANYAPELMTLDVAPGGAGWAAGETITGNTSGSTCVIVSVLTTKTYRVKDRDAAYTDGEVLTNGTATADQGAGYPALTGDPFGADASDDCPSCVAIFEQRLVLSNTNNNPQKTWGSVSGDYEDMTVGTNAGDAFIYVIGTEEVNAIRWLKSGKVLLMGTSGGLFSMSSGDDFAAVTPTNVTVKLETTYGSINLVPVKIGNFVYFIQRNSKTLRETAYNYDNNTYKAFDMTIRSEHISGDGIVDMAYQQSPYNMLWLVRDDGQIATLTREIDQEVIAWSRQRIGGSFGTVGWGIVETISIVPGDEGDDQIWMIVKRTINGSTVRYVEYLNPMDFGDEHEDAFFVDSGLTTDVAFDISAITKADPGVVTTDGSHGLSNGNIVIIRGVSGMTEVNQTQYKVASVTDTTFELTNTSTSADIDTTGFTTYTSGGEVRKCNTAISGLDHLEAETVKILADAIVGAEKTVAGGAITLTTPANGGGEIHVGLAYTTKVQTVRLEAGSEMGTAQSKVKRIQKVVMRVFEAMGMKAGNPNKTYTVDFGSSSPVQLYTGDKDMLFPSDYTKDGYVYIYQDNPIPLTILAIITYVRVFES